MVIMFNFHLYVICRNYFHAAYYYLEDSPPIPPAIISDWDMTADHENTIPLLEFPKHVACLHADGDIGFSKEYEGIQAAAMQQQYLTEYSQHPDNKLKNRYLNILACKFNISAIVLYTLMCF